ncbi:MAG: Stp1/IreP family PP2C-type Ser/Thr phosphatase [Silvibacterium sp.]|nr:Stp1/IreP family PP2C-type Ser/Thr phosphatase [Silvibacterium sp.]MBV8438609.1 Stp1/IreP family PP2C-type Ser/Thr phosphatase [Silvibacterium sp.]
MLKLEAAGRTDVGQVRTTNEDAFGYCVDDGIFALCDGMGGAVAGEVASRIAVDTLIERLCAARSLENRHKVLEEAIATANQRVHSRAELDCTLRGMGTTLVALAIGGDHALIGHVGDSRCYLFRDGKLIRMTLDHSLVDEQVRLGQLTQDEADHSPLRNVITRAIGTQVSVAADIAELDLKGGDILLLCSDGLTRELSDDRIAALLAQGGNVDELCGRLIDAAKVAGGHDNVTAILVRAV